MAYVRTTVETELNGVDDNPLLFPTADGGKVVSGGNFHGHPLALPMDTLAMAMSTIANMGQRRIDHLLGGSAQFGLPPKLSPRPEDSSGLAVLNILAGAIVSETKTLSVPASVDSIPTDATEDYVSMGPLAGSKARAVLANVETCLALELLCACQAFDVSGRRPAAAIAPVYASVRHAVAPVDDDRPLDVDIARVRELIHSGTVASLALSE